MAAGTGCGSGLQHAHVSGSPGTHHVQKRVHFPPYDANEVYSQSYEIFKIIWREAGWWARTHHLLVQAVALEHSRARSVQDGDTAGVLACRGGTTSFQGQQVLRVVNLLDSRYLAGLLVWVASMSYRHLQRKMRSWAP